MVSDLPKDPLVSDVASAVLEQLHSRLSATLPGYPQPRHLPANFRYVSTKSPMGFQDQGLLAQVESVRNNLICPIPGIKPSYAVAISSYSENGFAVKRGAQQTKQVGNLFVSVFGKPRRKYLVGASLGGGIVTYLPEDPDTGTYFSTALGMIQNTSPFDCTHHPAMNVPIAKSDGLPIGMMLIGKHYEDDKVLKAAHAIEKAGWYKG